MAITQASSDKKTVGMVTEKDAGRFVKTSIGGVDIYTGSGVPAHSAVKGSICVDVNGADMYVCTVATGTWKKVTRAS